MEPKVIIFLCNWSTYPGLQLSRMSENGEKGDHEIVINMCAGRISPDLIVESFKKGAWGILVVGCPPDACEHDGNYKTRRRIFLLKNTLDQFGINPQRLKLEWIDKGETAKFETARKEFIGMIKELGPIKELQEA